MTTVDKLIALLENNRKRISEINDSSLQIIHDINIIVDSYPINSIQDLLRGFYPHYVCTECSGPHGEYFMTYLDCSLTTILGSGDNETASLREALKKVLTEQNSNTIIY